MKINTFFRKTNLNNSLLIGYYGGTNFGDELLLEVLQNFFVKNKHKNISIRYTNQRLFSRYHKNFNHNIINGKITSLVKSLFKSKNVIIGGGGLWGLDFNKNMFLLGCILFIARFILFKKVYLIGVGYYNSASSFARLGAFVAGMSANVIIARDNESFDNFQKTVFFNKQNIFIDKDIALYIPEFIDKSDYAQELILLEKNIKFEDNERLNIIGLRRFKDKEIEKQFIINFKKYKDDKNTFFAFEDMSLFAEQYDNVCKEIGVTPSSVINFDYNPVALYFFLQKNNKKIKIFAPQFHVIMIAYLAGVEFVPIAYDNKVLELLRQINIPQNEIIKLY